MITVSPEFQEQLDANNHDYLVNVDITLKNNTTLPTITKDQLFKCSIEDAVGSDSKFDALGSAIVNQAILMFIFKLV